MKLKNLLFFGLSAFSLSVFSDPILPEGGTLLFYESFNDGATAEKNPELDAYKVGGIFYNQAPNDINDDWFNHPDPSTNETRWAYPNKSNGRIWRPTANADTPPTIEFMVNTSAFEYAYFSAASLFWGSYKVYYSFDDWATEHELSQDLFYRTYVPTTITYEDCGIAAVQGKPDCQADMNWYYDQFIENLGGKEAVYIKVVCISGSPLELDDIQVTGYTSAVLFKGGLDEKIKEVSAFYEKNRDNENEEYCPTKLEALPKLIEAATAVNEKADATQEEINEVLLPLSQAYTSVETKDEVSSDVIDAFKDAYAHAGEIDIEAQEYQQWVPEATRTAFEEALAQGSELYRDNNYCDENYATELTQALTELTQLTQQYVSIEEASTSTFSLYPNPAGETIYISGATGGNAYIFNAAGQQVQSISSYQGGAINISSLAPGVYTIVYERQSIPFIKK
ncbi:MAG: T9SS type A sorting domain-containing protein [Bacteroidales bacterium]|nr:T9SS type A sorting domain-containing protein [Bacteroidales bacterium]